MAKSKALKPTQIWIEIDSDGEDEAPSLKGAARGLNSRNVIASSATMSVESTSRSTATPLAGASGEKHVTRATRNGRPSVNYDMKLHPMDFVIRPNSAAVRRRSKYVSFPSQQSDDESDLSSMTLSGSSEDGDENEDDEQDEISSDSPVHRVAVKVKQREPDSQASRHSSRAEAKKPVNYSKKHHPQDYGLPGHRHSAIMPPPMARKHTPKPSQSQRKRKAKIISPTIPDSDESDEDAIESIPARLSDNDDDEPPLARRTSARQPLSSMDPNSRRAKRRRRSDRRSISPEASYRSSTRKNIISDMNTDVDGVNQLVDTFTAANDSPVRCISQAEASSATLDGMVLPNDAVSVPFMLAVVRPYIGHLPASESHQPKPSSVAPEELLSKQRDDIESTTEPRQQSQRMCESHPGFQSTSRQCDAGIDTLMRDEQHDNGETASGTCLVEMNLQAGSDQCVQKAIDQMMNEQHRGQVSSQTQSESPKDSQAESEQQDAEADASTSCEQPDVETDCSMEIWRHPAELDKQTTSERHTFAADSVAASAQHTVDGSPPVRSEQRNVEDPMPSHFEEAMAVTEIVDAGETNHEQTGDDVDEQSAYVEARPSIKKATDGVSSSLAGSPDPIDLLPRFSDFDSRAGSLPSTAEPESDRTDSDPVDNPLASISQDLAEGDGTSGHSRAVSSKP